jgi:hypothetical protein
MATITHTQALSKLAADTLVQTLDGFLFTIDA